MGKIVGLTFDEATAHVCPHCGKAYKTPDGLANHIKDKHPEAAGGSEGATGGSPEQ